MSEDKNIPNPFADDDDFDWDDALKEWEQELDRVTSRPPASGHEGVPAIPPASQPGFDPETLHEISETREPLAAVPEPEPTPAPAPTLKPPKRARTPSLSLELDDPLGLFDGRAKRPTEPGPAISSAAPRAPSAGSPSPGSSSPGSSSPKPRDVATTPPPTPPVPTIGESEASKKTLPPFAPTVVPPAASAVPPPVPADSVTDPSPPPSMPVAQPTQPLDLSPPLPVTETDALVLEGFDELFASVAPGRLEPEAADAAADSLGELAPRVEATAPGDRDEADGWMRVDTDEVKVATTDEVKVNALERSLPPEPPSTASAKPEPDAEPPPPPPQSPEPTVTAEVDPPEDDLLAFDAFPDPDDVDLSLERSGPPPPLPQVGSARPSAEAGERRDAGAQVAKRTVRYRKPRQEHFPLVGNTNETLSARRALLEKLAEQVIGAVRGRLLCAAAALSAQLGETERIEALYEAAHVAAPKDVVALRALRKGAVARGEWTKAAELLEKEAALPLSDEDRATSLLLLAEIQLTRLSDAAGARRSARTALGFQRESVAAALLFAEASQAEGNAGDIAMALGRAAESWNDDRAKGTLFTLLARAAEQRGQTEHAADLYRQALEHTDLVEALAGYARTQRDTAGPWPAAAGLAWLAARFGGTPLGERLSRASTHLLLRERPADTLVNLARAKQRLSFETRAAAARAVRDVKHEARALEGCANAAGGTDRALAMVRLAELRSEEGDLLGADEALQAATLADAKLGLIRVVREVIARRSGDPTRLARALSGVPGQSLAAAAKLARDASSAERERDLLEQARSGDEAPAAADVLALDLAAAAGDREGVDAGLRRQADRAAEGRKAGVLLTLGESALARGDMGPAAALFTEAHESAPGEPFALRPLARLVGADSREDAAALWLEESAASSGAQAAFAATYAGRLFGARDSQAVDAYHRALDAFAFYPPARWALGPLSRRMGKHDVVASLNERLAEQTETGDLENRGRKGRLLVRAALARASAGDQTAAGSFQRALQVCPDDTVLGELILSHQHVFPRGVLAEVLEQLAERTPEELAEAAALRAATAFEEAGDPARTAQAYRSVLARFGTSPLTLRAIDRAELAAGEGARVAERRFTSVKEAESGPARALALERLAEFDLFERDDAGAAVLSYHSILEVAEGHVPSLRRLERYYMEHARNPELAEVERALGKCVASGPDAAAHVRLAARIALAAEDAPGTAADRLLLELHPRAGDSPWVARRTLAAARASGAGEVTATRVALLAGQATSAAEAAARTLAACDALDAMERRSEGLGLIDRALQSHDARELLSSPLFAERFGELAAEQGRRVEAADAYEAAATGARVAAHRASLWYKAADLWEKEGDRGRAVEAFTAAAEANVLYRDVFERLRALFESQANTEGLIALLHRRIGAGGEPTALAELFGSLSSLELERGSREKAKEALRHGLTLEPENVGKLKRLADLCLEDEDWRGAAESLIRVARVRRDGADLCDVFYKLGDIYDVHMPDARRAEAAFKRVVRLVPNHTDAIARLAALYEREGNHAVTTEMLVLLIQHEREPTKILHHRLRLATAYERRGDLRRAEAVLEETRRGNPTDGPTVRAIADFYQRQNAGPALSMHLNRAANDFRHALETHPSEARFWHGLIDILRWRGRQDAASAIASAASALGTLGPELATLVGNGGAARGAGPSAFDESLLELVAPPSLSRVSRLVFRRASEALDRCLPFDPKSHGADRLRSHPILHLLDEMVSWTSAGPFTVFRADDKPYACTPLSKDTLLVGSSILDECPPDEQRFLLARAIKIAQEDLAIVVRSNPDELRLVVTALIRSYDPNHRHPDVDRTELEEMTRKVSKAIHRRVRDELTALVIEMAGIPGFDPDLLPLAVCELGDRTALVALGSMPAALSALLKVYGRALDGDAFKRVKVTRDIQETRSLMDFAICDLHFEARRRAGLGS